MPSSIFLHPFLFGYFTGSIFRDGHDLLAVLLRDHSGRRHFFALVVQMLS